MSDNHTFQTLPLNFSKNNQLTTWKNIVVTTENECFEITEKNDIVVKDSICEGMSVQPFISTKQKGNISWTFENGSPSTSNQLNPGKIKFNTAGKFKIQAILKISECFSDTITKFVTVLPQPIINLPKDTIICNQNVFNITANVQNAPNWKWEDSKTNQNPRPLTQDGKYTININAGECKANASISVKFRKTDALFSAPDSICENIKITLIASQKVDAKHSWIISPTTILPLVEANPKPFLLAKGIYSITHAVDNDGCKS